MKVIKCKTCGWIGTEYDIQAPGTCPDCNGHEIEEITKDTTGLTDKDLYKVWQLFNLVKCDDTFGYEGTLEENFFGFKNEEPMDDVYRWFDEHYSKGVAFLMDGRDEGEDVNRVLTDDEVKRYKKYQLQWMIDHGYTLDDLIDALESVRKDSEPGTTLHEIAAEWEQSQGFGSGSIYVCEAEWKQYEGKEPDVPAFADRKQRIFLPLSTGDLLYVEENTPPEFGSEVMVGICDKNANHMQMLADVRENNGKAQILVYRDPYDDDNYTDNFSVPFYKGAP